MTLGSIAQVYRAVLDGQQVAVKVRHPNVYEQIKLDFTIMKAIASMLLLLFMYVYYLSIVYRLCFVYRLS